MNAFDVVSFFLASGFCFRSNRSPPSPFRKLVFCCSGFASSRCSVCFVEPRVSISSISLYEGGVGSPPALSSPRICRANHPLPLLRVLFLCPRSSRLLTSRALQRRHPRARRASTATTPVLSRQRPLPPRPATVATGGTGPAASARRPPATGALTAQPATTSALSRRQRPRRLPPSRPQRRRRRRRQKQQERQRERERHRRLCSRQSSRPPGAAAGAAAAGAGVEKGPRGFTQGF